jgi:DNA-binding beta-propeller fold protein YncE
MMLIRALVLAFTLSAGVSLAGCERSKPPLAPVVADSLQVVRIVALDVREPSDLCLDRDGVHWWTVSDNTGLVYKLRLSDCAVVRTLGYHGVDPEGIWQDPADGTLYVTEELTREIVHMDSTGKVLSKVSVAGLGGDANSGLEGITSGPVTGSFYVTQEKSPARLVEVDSAGTVLALHDVSYVGDLSGVTHDPRTAQLVVVSDESRKVCWTTLAGDLVSSWRIPVTKAEGIAVDTTRSRVYVVSDREERFYEFRLP